MKIEIQEDANTQVPAEDLAYGQVGLANDGALWLRSDESEVHILDVGADEGLIRATAGMARAAKVRVLPKGTKITITV